MKEPINKFEFYLHQTFSLYILALLKSIFDILFLLHHNKIDKTNLTPAL